MPILAAQQFVRPTVMHRKNDYFNKQLMGLLVIK